MSKVIVLFGVLSVFVGFVPKVAVGAVVSLTTTEIFVEYVSVMFVVFIVMLYVPGVAVALNQKYIVSLPLTMYPVVFVQLRMLLIFVKMDSVALVPFVPRVNVNSDGRVILMDVMFASCPIFVLFIDMLYRVCIISFVL